MCERDSDIGGARGGGGRYMRGYMTIMTEGHVYGVCVCSCLWVCRGVWCSQGMHEL